MEAFEKLTDPRNGKAKRHYFGEILFIALAAMICGMEGFDDFERFTKLKETWLRRFLKLPPRPAQRRYLPANLHRARPQPPPA